jgi:hypothetical protein
MPTFPTIPPVPEAPRKKPLSIIAAALIIIVIIAVVGGGYMLMKNMQTNTTVVQPVTTTIPTTQTTVSTLTPTPVVTMTVPTVSQTSKILIPQTGVWAEIIYDQTYSGFVGMPGMQVQVSDTGDHYYRIPTEYGIVAVSVQKNDGSGDQLKVNVYSNGLLVKTASTTIPEGNVDLQVSLATPTPTPTLTPLPTLPLTSNKTAGTA